MLPLLIDLVLYGVSALFAWVTGASSNLGPHRGWGGIAVWGYAAAFVISLFFLRGYQHKHRLWLTITAWIGVTWVPLVALAVTDRAQEEVFVVEESARRLVESGSPYLDRAAIAEVAEPLLAYTPYQPGMSLFGLPYAAFGARWWTDARIYFAVFTAAVLFVAIRLLIDRYRASGSGPDADSVFDRRLVRAVQAATVLPLSALTLATGGDDLPVLALCLLAFALAACGRDGWSGAAVGAAAAMKLFAWPVLLVLAFFMFRRRFLIPAIGVPVAALLPSLLIDAQAVVENVIRFPTGGGLVTSPAASPLIGYLIAGNLPHGRLIALSLLGVAGLGIGAYLLRRPPRDAAAVANVCAVGLLAAILLMPATRFGYLLYPVAFAFWAPLLRQIVSPRRPAPE